MRGKRKSDTATCRLDDNWDGIPVDMRDGCVFLADLKSTIKRAGHARDLMEMVMAEAKRKHKILIVEPRAFADGMTDKELARWYERLGFETIQKKYGERPWLMAKPPK